MKMTPEELFKRYIAAIFADASLDFFVERTASFLSTLMPVSSLLLYRAKGSVTTRIAECTKTPGVHVDEVIRIPEETMERLRTEKHFFTAGGCEIRVFTGREDCTYAELHRAIYRGDTSAIYIPLKYSLLKETSVTLLVTSPGLDNYTEEHAAICAALQPVLVDCLLNILSERTQDAASPSPSERLGEPFLTFDEFTVRHITDALTRTNGKISGTDGAAVLLGLNPSTLWSKIREYRINVKGLEREAGELA